nr:MAG TPA: Golgin subfamily A member 5 [Caudoviricetes sp.]
MGFFNKQTGNFCRWVYGGSRSALVFIYTWLYIVFLHLFIFILSNLYFI